MKKVYKSLSVILAILTLLSIIPAMTFTAFAQSKGLFYYDVSKGKATITGLTDRDYRGELKIPSEISGYPVTGVGRNAFIECVGLTSLTIPKSVINIGYGAFEGCNGLEKITVSKDNSILHSSGNCLIVTKSKVLIAGCKNSKIPTDGSVTSIYDVAFWNCTGLKSIVIPNKITSIGAMAFAYCTGLKSVTISDSVKSIADNSFYDCKIKKIIIAAGAKTVREDMVLSKDTLESIIIPNSVKKIGDGAFSDCFGLRKVVLPDSLTSIGDGAFLRAWIESIKIPKSVKSIGRNVFYYCAALKSIKIPNSVTSIGNGAFYHCTNIESIIIPDSVKLIDESAFSYCWSLQDVYYTGTKQKKEAISIKSGNDNLLNVKWHYARKISYTLNGGKNNSSNPKYYYDDSTTIKLKNPTRKGYSFKGWYSNKKLTKKTNTIKKGSKGNKTFYAKWSKNKYIITYKLNKGKNSKNNPKSYTVTTSTIKLKNPARRGYTFKGWFSDKKLTKKVAKITKGSVGNRILYAKWKKK